ncbi:MAG: hypothetical protein PHW04_03215 [Candidatus Wallbacteria bacterium]|nr:hypothetical protein [Candidatus Wallbacteria bacterium]
MADWSNVNVESAELRRRKRTQRVKVEKKEKEQESKKKQFRLMMLSLTIFLFVIIGFSMMIYFKASASNQKTTVERMCGSFEGIIGKVELFKKDTGFYDKLDPNQKFAENDKLRTSDSAEVVAKFPDLSYVKLFGQTEIGLTGISLAESDNPEYSALNLKIDFQSGELVVCLPKGKGGMEINTPLGKLVLENLVRTMVKIDSIHASDDFKANHPIRIVVQSGALKFTDKLGIKDITLKNFQEVYIWDQQGQLRSSKQKEINPAAERF